jgi:hypothetical protein
MTSPEPRWRQRLENLQRALGQLQAALEALARDPGNEVIGMAVIKAYEFSFELSWKTLKDWLSHEGIDALVPREVVQNRMAHTYDVSRARIALALIRERFAPALLALAKDLEQRL